MSLIKSKYVKTFQEIIENFNRFFAEEEGFKKIKDDKNFTKLHHYLEKQSKSVQQISAHFKKDLFPIGAFSKLLGKDLFTTWSGLLGNQNLLLRCASGSTEEQNQELNLALNEKEVVIDLIALFTLAHLECLNVLKKMFEKVYITTSSRDKILEIIGDHQIDKRKSYLTASSQDGKFIHEEISPEDLAKVTSFLQKLFDFVNENLTVSGFKHIFSSEEDRLREMIGENSLDSIKLAEERNCVIYSDDLSLRSLAQMEKGIKGVSIQNVLRAALEKNLITRPEYEEKILTLVKSNYDYISISADTLWYCVEKENFKETSDVKLLFSRIEKKETSISSAINVLGEFTKLVWLKATLPQTQFRLLELSLNTLCKERGILQTIELLKRILRIKLKLNPIHLREILRLIDDWKNNQLILF